ncbi:MAG: hypothetical protein ACRENP_09265 [Longimicrobiales bacterium]
MSARLNISLAFLVLGSLAICGPQPGQAQTPVVRTTVINVAALHPKFTARDRIVDLVRSRLPLAIRYGRFTTDSGESHLCIFSRRFIGHGMSATPSDPFSVVPCTMIAAYLDGQRIQRPAAFFERTSPLAVESIELVSASVAHTRYGLEASDPEVLLLWTRNKSRSVRSNN